MPVPTYTKTGSASTTSAKLDKSVFEVGELNQQLIKDVYDAYLANGRINLARVKTRGLVRGGGKKPWAQKGTGRARFGSSRTPIWRSGGIVFGPSGGENYSKDVNVKAKRLALRQALSQALKEKRISVIEEIPESIVKTSEMVKLLKKLKAHKYILIVTDNISNSLVRSTSNLRGVEVVSATYLNIYDLLNSDSIIFTSKALSATTAWLKDSEARK